MSCALCTVEYYLLSVFDFHSVHFRETKDFCEMFKIMKFCAIVLCTCTGTWTSCTCTCTSCSGIGTCTCTSCTCTCRLLDDIILAIRLTMSQWNSLSIVTLLIVHP